MAFGQEGAVPVYDCALVVEEGDARSRKDALLWKKALQDAGFTSAEVDSRRIETASLEDGRLGIDGALYASRFSAACLDTLTNFILMGGKLAASGPAPFDASAVSGAEGRSPARLRAQMQRINEYTSRTDPWDEICGALVLRGLPGVRATRPALRGDRPLPEAGVSLARTGGRRLWQIAIDAQAAFSGALRLPFPASRIAYALQGGSSVELGSAAGPEVSVRIAPGVKALLQIEQGAPASVFPAQPESGGWTVQAGGAPSRALRSQADWGEAQAEGGERIYRAVFADLDLPIAPPGGSLRLDLSASAGALLVSMNGRTLPPVPGDETLFAVPISLLQEENRLEVRVSPQPQEDDDNPPGLFACPDWQVAPAGELLAISIG